MIQTLCSSPLFGLLLSLAAYAVGTAVSKKLRSPLANPLLIAIALCILVLVVLDVPLSSYKKGADSISMFLAPATAVLSISIYRQFKTLRENFLPVVLGCTVGSAASMGSILLMCRFFGLDEVFAASILPKSVTTPIAMEISAQHGGIVPLTVACVVITGILGNILAPILIKVFRVKNPVAAGVGVGTCSHAIGTSKAIEIGEVQGAMSGIAIGVAGVMTVLLSMFLF